MKGASRVKKSYETPELSLLVLKTFDFLNSSGEAVETDDFTDEYGERFV